MANQQCLSDDELLACCEEGRDAAATGDKAKAQECFDKLTNHADTAPKGGFFDQPWVKMAVQLAIQLLQAFLANPTVVMGKRKC